MTELSKLMRKALAAEKLRRQREAQSATDRQAREVREAHWRGMNAAAPRPAMPPDLMEAIVRWAQERASDMIAREFLQKEGSEISMIAGRVSSRIIKSQPWALLDEGAIAYWTDFETQGLNIELTIPSIRIGHTVSRLLLMDFERRATAPRAAATP